MNTRIAIYGLVDPRSGEIHYIGRSRQPTLRMSDHSCRHARPGNRRLQDWIDTLLDANRKPSLVILRWYKSQNTAMLAEFKWIERARKWKWPILNGLGRHGCISGIFCEFPGCVSRGDTSMRCSKHQRAMQ